MFNTLKRACAILAITTAPALADSVMVTTAAGQAEVPAAPAKIAVFDLAALDTLVALDVAVAGVPNRLFLDALSTAAADAAVVGTLFEPDMEALAVLSPDLIVAGGRSSKALPTLARVAPTIDMTIWGEDMVGQAKARVQTYGAIFGKEDAATALIDKLDTAIAQTAAAAADKGTALIVLTNGGKISAYGIDGRFGWLHDAIGLPQAHEGLENTPHGQAISFEFIAEVNPDWLIVVDRAAAIGQDGEAAAATLDNPLVAGTTAAQKGQIVYLDSAPIYVAGGGIPSMLHSLAELKSAFAAAQ